MTVPYVQCSKCSNIDLNYFGPVTNWKLELVQFIKFILTTRYPNTVSASSCYLGQTKQRDMVSEIHQCRLVLHDFLTVTLTIWQVDESLDMELHLKASGK